MTVAARTRRVVLAVAGVGAASIVAFFAFRPAAVPVEAASVDSGPVRVTVDWTGKTRVRNRYQVRAPVSGELERIALRPGDPVRTGEVLARIAGAAPPPLDTRSRAELVARIAAARAAVVADVAAFERAKAAAIQARSDAERAELVSRGGGLTPQALDSTRAEARVREEEQRMAEATVVRARAEVAEASAALDTGAKRGSPVEVEAPVDGAVLRVLRESAGPVALGEPLLELGDPSDLEVVLDLPTADAVRVHLGDRAVVTGWGGGAPLSARVHRVEPSAYTKVSPLGVEEQRVDVLLDPVGEGWSELGDGYSVDVKVVAEELPHATRVPRSALFRTGSGWSLYVVRDGRARRRSVEVSAFGGATAAIRAGVTIGERVLIRPGDEVSDGTRVVVY
jgi:HlyD family secretion protein